MDYGTILAEAVLCLLLWTIMVSISVRVFSFSVAQDYSEEV